MKLATRRDRFCLGLFTALSLGFPATSWSAEAGVAVLPARICGGGATTGSSAALQDGARSAEALLSRSGADSQRGDRALDALAVSADGASGIATPTSIAAYCSAAGESMRLARTGSQFQAQLYLITAIKYAEEAGESDLSAIASYRLALATVGGPVIADTRGGGGSPTEQRAALRTRPSADPPSGDSCKDLYGALLLRLPGPVVAQKSLSCANARARTAGDFELASLTGLRLARLSGTMAAESPDAGPALRERSRLLALSSLSDASRIESAPLQVELIGRLTETAIEAGARDEPQLDAAVSTMRAAAGAAPEAEAYADALQGRLALQRGDREQAKALLRQAVYRESQRAQPLRQADWLIWLAMAEPERRAELTTAAYRALEAVRPFLPLVDPITEEPTFALRMQPVFEQALEVQLAGYDPAGETPRIALAQQIVETYRQAEIQSALGADCVPAREAIKPSDLRVGEVLLYPILLGDRIELIYAEGGPAGSHYKRLPANRDATREAVSRLVGDMVASTSGEPNDAWRSPARQLYQLLIGPIEDRLSPEGTLIIVPDGPLRGLPFAALVDAQGKFLVERTRISVAPALTYSQPGLDRTSRLLDVVAASLQKDVSLPAGFFAKLDGAAAEARVAAAAGGSRSRVIPDFRKADLQAALASNRVDVLHVATHAAFNGRSDRSFIVANGEAIPMADLRSLITVNRARGDELELLVLSACETAIGDDQASMGLAGAAVQSGARSALASLWQVDDQGTVTLMTNFYEGYGAGMSKAQALRSAQLKLIAAGGDLAQPSIWAAFTLLGGWR